MTQATCAFCRILDGAEPAAFVAQDERCVAFLDRRPVFYGHTLVVPRRHVDTLPELPAELLVPLFRMVQLVSRAAESGLGAEGTWVSVNTKVSQSVPHVHVHVVPRTFSDGLKGFFWPRQRYRDDAHMAETAATLAEAINRLSEE